MGFYTILAGDFGLSDEDPEVLNTLSHNGYTYKYKQTATYGIQLNIGWNGIVKRADNDKDGFSNDIDKCMDVAEDKDGFEDEDGCPDLDNDGDGIMDTHDSCPNEKATSNGCPVFDAEGDGILDADDKCPQQYEDFDGFEDEDGCPEPDNDGDGILDKDDKCPNIVEDRDGFEDTDGCPDLDNDGDGIPDGQDKCPGAKGSSDNNGCPGTTEIRDSLILDGVTFLSGKARLDPNSFTILDKVVQSLKEWPEVSVEIRGFTDSDGDDQSNLKLSKRRAEAVMHYFTEKGIRPMRLIAVGYGETNPIADNATADGRARNRRVEIHRIR
jgi:outer membrane protein OmpA-like peptidoglycan-associated protein